MPSLFLMVLGTDLDPERVSKALALRASQSWRRGDPKRVAERLTKSVHKWGGWKVYFPSPKTEKALIRKMMAVTTRLSARKRQIRALRNEGHEILLVSLVQETSRIVIPPELHRRLAELGVSLQIDFWAE